MHTHDELNARLAAAGLSAAAETIRGLVRPCYHITRTPAADAHLPIGTSRFGGLPDVAAGFVWPEVTTSQHPVAMEFVGQIRLQDLPHPVPESLPSQGLLSFFARWNEGRVLFFPEGTPLQRAVSPRPPETVAPTGIFQKLFAGLARKPEPHRTYRPCTLALAPGISLPDGSSAMVDQLKLSHADAEAYVESVLEPLPEPHHQMFGYARPVQTEMEIECDFLRRHQEVAWNSPTDRFVAATRDWVLILQVDTDENGGPGWMWGDAGIVYFWIHRDDLAARAFDKVICIEQCH